MKSIKEKRVVYLYEAVIAGTIRAAADKLNIAPSAISRQITLLEDELGVKLVERQRNGVATTQAGDIVLSYYRQSLSNEENCVAKLSALQGLQSGHIKLIIGEGFVSDLMCGPLADFAKKYPGLTLSVNLAGTNEVIRLVETDEAHIGLLYHPANHPHIRSHVINQQPICAVVNPDHFLAQAEIKKQPLYLTDITQYSLALPESHFGVRQLISLIEFKERIRLKARLTSNSIAVLKHFVTSNMGITLLPEFVVAAEVIDKKLVAIPLADEGLNSAQAHMITRLGRQLPSAAQQLLVHLTQWMRAFK